MDNFVFGTTASQRSTKGKQVDQPRSLWAQPAGSTLSVTPCLVTMLSAHSLACQCPWPFNLRNLFCTAAAAEQPSRRQLDRFSATKAAFQRRKRPSISATGPARRGSGAAPRAGKGAPLQRAGVRRRAPPLRLMVIRHRDRDRAVARDSVIPHNIITRTYMLYSKVFKLCPSQPSRWGKSESRVRLGWPGPVAHRGTVAAFTH